jgi:hypothetical protein
LAVGRRDLPHLGFGHPSLRLALIYDRLGGFGALSGSVRGYALINGQVATSNPQPRLGVLGGDPICRPPLCAPLHVLKDEQPAGHDHDNGGNAD